MRFDALTLLGTATQATQAALSNAIAQLLRGLGKRAAQIGCADAEKKLAALAAANDRVIVAGTGAAAMKDEALAASRAGCPVLLVMDGAKGFAAVSDDIAKAIALLQPCSVYVTGIVVTGADLTRAEEDALNDAFGKNGESPVRIICEDIAQAKDAEAALHILARHADCDILRTRLCCDAADYLVYLKGSGEPTCFAADLFKIGNGFRNRFSFGDDFLTFDISDYPEQLL